MRQTSHRRKESAPFRRAMIANLYSKKSYAYDAHNRRGQVFFNTWHGAIPQLTPEQAEAFGLITLDLLAELCYLPRQRVYYALNRYDVRAVAVIKQPVYGPQTSSPPRLFVIGEAVEVIFRVKPRETPPTYSNEHLLEAIQWVYAQVHPDSTDQRLSMAQYREVSTTQRRLPDVRTIMNRFGGWKSAKRQAGVR